MYTIRTQELTNKEPCFTTRISIVVPAYNVEKYIVQCLESLVNQTWDNYQIIIVNDGSTDLTGDICKKYTTEYQDKVKCVSQANKGLGAARNAGLSLVDTPYVSFLDSDDWQDIRFVEKFSRLLEHLDYEPDIVFTLPHCYDAASRLILDWMDKPLYQTIFDQQGKTTPINCINCPSLYMLEVNANRKIYRTDFLQAQNFSFPEGVKWEDIRPHIQLLHTAKCCVGLSDTGFIYRTNSEGQITEESGTGRLDMIPVLIETVRYINAQDFSKEELAYIICLICKYVIWTINMTDIYTIQDLLKGFHDIFKDLPPKLVQSLSDANFIETNDKNKFLGLIDCLTGQRYMQLKNYEDRSELLRYWAMRGVPSSNIVERGLQCIKDSGILYTIKLILYKLSRGELKKWRN